MSLAKVLPYFREVFKEQGHKEWTDAFNFEAIPSTIIDGSFHMELAPLDNLQQNQSAIEFEQKVTIRLFVKGFRENNVGRDKAIGLAETIIKQSLKSSRRLNAGGIKNVKLGTLSFEPFGESNDNIILARMEFVTFVILDPDTGS